MRITWFTECHGAEFTTSLSFTKLVLVMSEFEKKLQTFLEHYESLRASEGGDDADDLFNKEFIVRRCYYAMFHPPMVRHPPYACSARIESENRVDEVQGAEHVSSWEWTATCEQEEESLQGYFALWVASVARTPEGFQSSVCFSRSDWELWPLVNGCKESGAWMCSRCETHYHLLI